MFADTISVQEERRYLYPSLPIDRALSARVRRAIASRRTQWRRTVPPLARIVYELRAATGRSSFAIGADIVKAWLSAGIDPRTYVANLMWNAPAECWKDFVCNKEMAPFFAATIDAEDRLLMRDKAAFADHDRRHGMPWLPTLAIVNRYEEPQIEAANVITEASALLPTLDSLAEEGDLFLKPSCGKQGHGAYLFARGRPPRDADGHGIADDLLVERTFAYRHPDGPYGYVVQRALDPHPAIVELTGIEVLSTVRVVTAVRDGDVHILHFLLKVPAPGRVTDNFNNGTAGTVIAGIDADTGRLMDIVGIFRPGHRLVCERTHVHPVTGRKMSGQEFPGWKEALELTRRAALLHPRTATLGWDIALTPSGWVFLDVNVMWGPSGSQVCTGEGMRPVLARLFPEIWTSG